MSTHHEFEQWVPFPLEQVFAFFSDPENLPRIMPAASRTRRISVGRKSAAGSPGGFANTAGVGSVIVTSFRVFPFLPLRARWVARITEFELNHYFADVQERGPFKSWHHRHEFAAEKRDGVEGCVVRDVIDYEVGFGFFGEMVNGLFVRRDIERKFAERQRRLPQLLA